MSADIGVQRPCITPVKDNSWSSAEFFHLTGKAPTEAVVLRTRAENPRMSLEIARPRISVSKESNSKLSKSFSGG